MSNAETGFRSGPGRSDHLDPVTSVIVAMRDACRAGAAASESANRPSQTAGNTGDNTGAVSASEAWIGTVGAVTADLVSPIGQAMMIAASRSASYWLGLTQILATHQARTVRTIAAAAIEGDAAEAQPAAAAERLRALLREVGDLATREARLLQNDFGNLGENLAQTLRQPDLGATYRRRWRAKL